MKRLPHVRRLVSAALVGVLVVTAVSLVGAAPATAAPATNHYYMLVNDSYEKCLSMNAAESPTGGGTKRVYLATCNANTPAQWWYFASNENFRNYQNFDNQVWELSSNSTTPAGGGAGTFGAYAAVESQAEGHGWSVIDYTVEHKVRFQSHLSGYMLSASSSNPYSSGIYRVYTAPWTSPVPPAHLWRFWDHPSGPPTPCYPCGEH